MVPYHRPLSDFKTANNKKMLHLTLSDRQSSNHGYSLCKFTFATSSPKLVAIFVSNLVGMYFG